MAELLSGKSAEEIMGPEGLLKQLAKAVVGGPWEPKERITWGTNSGEVLGSGSYSDTHVDWRLLAPVGFSFYYSKRNVCPKNR